MNEQAKLDKGPPYKKSGLALSPSLSVTAT
jgi:hypothetical protein